MVGAGYVRRMGTVRTDTDRHVRATDRHSVGNTNFSTAHADRYTDQRRNTYPGHPNRHLYTAQPEIGGRTLLWSHRI